MISLKQTAIHLMSIGFLLLGQQGYAEIALRDSLNESLLPGLDYSRGRMVQGFGFTLDQYLEEQIEGDKEIASAFGVLFHPSQQITFDLYSAADAKRVNFREYLDYPANPISSVWHLQSRFRIKTSAEIKPYYSKTKSEERYNTTVLDNEQNISEKGEFVQYGVSAITLSRGGMLRLSPAQKLAEEYFDGFSIPVGRRQWLIQGIYHHQKESESGFGQIINASNNLDEAYQRQATHLTSIADSAHLAAYYGFDDHFQAGLHAGWILVEDKEKNGIAPAYTRYGALKTTKWFTSYDSNLYWPWNLLQSISLQYTHYHEQLSDVPGSSNDPADFDPQYRFSFSLYKLPGCPPPSAAQMLTETGGIFQKRLPGGQWLAGFNGALQSRAYGDYQSEVISSKYVYRTLVYSGKMKEQAYRLSAELRYGITDYIELGLESVLDHTKTRAEHDPDISGIRLTSQTWQHFLQVRFANFHYHPSDEAIYGWNTLDHFEQQFDPMLRRGMIKGTVRAGYFTYDKTFRYRSVLLSNDPLFTRYAALLQNLKWDFEAGCDWGITRFLTFSGRGGYSVFDSDDREFGDKDWEWISRLVWQPFHGLRVELNYQATRYTNYFKSRYHYQIIPYYYEYAYRYYNRTVQTWNIRLLSLF